MKLLISIIIVITLLGLMVYTNPSMENYNDYIRQNVMKETQKQRDDRFGQLLSPMLGGIAGNLVTSQTMRTDCVFFSIYELGLGKERLKAIGIFKNFILLDKPKMKP
jgi:hypothetical protein